MPGKPPHLVGERAAEGVRHPARLGARACVHVPRLRGGRATLRQGRRLRAPRDAGQAAARDRARARCCSTAATPGRARPPRCGRKGQDMIDAAKLLGVDVMTGHWEFTYGAERVQEVVEKDFKGRIDVPRAEREDHRLRRPGRSSRTRCARSTACRSPSSARRFRTRRSPTRATSCPTGPSASRTRTCRRWSTRCARRARRSSCCCRTTAWTST